MDGGIWEEGKIDIIFVPQIYNALSYAANFSPFTPSFFKKPAIFAASVNPNPTQSPNATPVR